MQVRNYKILKDTKIYKKMFFHILGGSSFDL